APEPEGGDLVEVPGRQHLAGGVARQAEDRVGCVHAATVVGDADGAEPTLLQGDVHAGRPRVAGVVDQLAHHRRRPRDHLPRRDQRGEVLVHLADLPHPAPRCGYTATASLRYTPAVADGAR